MAGEMINVNGTLKYVGPNFNYSQPSRSGLDGQCYWLGQVKSFDEAHQTVVVHLDNEEVVDTTFSYETIDNPEAVRVGRWVAVYKPLDGPQEGKAMVKFVFKELCENAREVGSLPSGKGPGMKGLSTRSTPRIGLLSLPHLALSTKVFPTSTPRTLRL